MFLIKSRDLSSLEVYQSSVLTLLSSFLATLNSAFNTGKSSLYFPLMYFFNISPYFLLINIAGILIPAPVPSSDNITSDTFSFFESIINAKDPPTFSIFLVWVTKEHLDVDSTINMCYIGLPYFSVLSSKPSLKESNTTLVMLMLCLSQP